MVTIRSRKLADGTVRYTAQIRVKCEGAQVYQESQIFAQKQTAQARRHRAGQSRWGDGQGNDCSGLMKPDTLLGENTRQIEVSDDQTTPYLFR